MLLPNHLIDAHSAAGRIVQSTGDAQLEALNLPRDRYWERLRQCMLLAAAVHDLGKANDHFQSMILGKRWDNPQGLRHEWVTLLMLHSLKAWLLPAAGNEETDFAIVEWAVAGHHPAVHHANPPKVGVAGAGVDIALHCGHTDFAECLANLKSAFNLPGDVPTLSDVKRSLVGGNNVFAEIGLWSRLATKAWQQLSPDDRRFVAAVKNGLVAADVAASALAERSGGDSIAWDWIDHSFAQTPKPGDLQRIVTERAKGFTERNADRERFQQAVANSPYSATFVKAGCGSGKTQAAYMWAAEQHPGRRLFFCYPTTGTATEGYKDYLHEAGVNADLFHSRRDVDFDIILTTGRDSGGDDSALRIASLDAWATPIVACTVDTVLGLVQNNRKGLYAWPALAQSAFVFDEIHAYDDRLFGALLRFLRDLPGLPALLMTASLPAPREDALRTVLKKHRGIELKPIDGPADLEHLPRYRKLFAKDNDPLALIEAELKVGGKVLWVCNTVRRVMAAADAASHLNPMIYHSRFKYEDRVQRHKQVIEAFTPQHKEAALAICSQVAEMSLDLKGCTLLVTDLATVPALIQRLGRLNRQAKAGCETRPFVLIEPENNLPYEPGDLEAARAWFDKLPADGISQKNLAEAWESGAENPPDLVASAWLDGGPVTTVLELREGSPGITVLMEQDRSRAKANPKSLGKYTLPMPPPPKSLNWREWPLFKGIPVAPAGMIRYDHERGAEWNA